MSRTYRRRKEKAPEWVTRDWEVVREPVWHCVPFQITGKEAKKEVSKWHSDTGYHGDYGDCPRWFNKLYHIIPARREAKRLQRQVIKLIDYEDSPEFPLWPGRTEYYW